MLKKNHDPKEMLNYAASATKKIFEDLVADEEMHFEQFDTEMENLEKFVEN